MPLLSPSITITLGDGKQFGITTTDEMFIQDYRSDDQDFILLGDATKENMDRLIRNIDRLRVHCN